MACCRSTGERSGWFALLVVTVLLAPSPVWGATIEKLLMPGKVSQAHVKQEEDCASCHDRADKSRQRALCLACHKDVAVDVQGNRGLHGRLPNIATGECKGCHSEHLGREGDIVKFSLAAFDHQATDFALEGAHRSLACEACHRPRTKFRQAGSACTDCHAKADVHRGQLGKDCGSCHGNLSWAGGRFDHDKTRFRLADAHAQVACNACHLGGRYKGTPLRCVSCHTPDDTHAGARGDKCQDCHTTAAWNTARFDHAREAQFPLEGRHARIACGACHRSGNLEDDLPRDCVGCHRADDSHAGRFGADCAKCHGHEQWKVEGYDHAARTGVALAAGHERLACHTCHTTDLKRQAPRKTCADCHRAVDPHGGALGGACDTCHGTEHWREGIRFDHDLTDYPLLGLHILPTCAQCHTTKAFKGAPRNCVQCHARDDVHAGKLGSDCAACHSPNGWKLWEFDHALQAHFELSGAHARLACVACHRQPAGQAPLQRDCAACHRKDDLHLGQFGPQCQRCHTTLSFKGARIQ
jgi:Cytochrome c7 and related cytochrome c/Cytochrome c3